MRLRKFTVKGLPSLSSCFFFVARKTMQIPSSYSVKMATFFEKLQNRPVKGTLPQTPSMKRREILALGSTPPS